MVHFIKVLVPKNSGLKDISESAIEYIKEKDPEKGIEILPFRGEDIPSLVEGFNERGFEAIGVTGEDLFIEYCLGNQSTLAAIKKVPWRNENFVFKKPTLCLLGPKGFSLKNKSKKLVCIVNRKYRFLSENFLEKLKRNGFNVEIRQANGNLEKAVEQGLADICVEIVCSGSSIKENNLEVLEKVFESDLVVVGKNSQTIFDLEELEKVIQERDYEKNSKSYTCKLLRNENLLAEKIREETLELIEAAEIGRKSKVVWEAADLLYFVSVLLYSKGVPVKAVFNELRRRNNESKRD